MFYWHAPGDLSYNIDWLYDALVSSKLDDLVVHWKNGQPAIQVDKGMDLHMFANYENVWANTLHSKALSKWKKW
jgi:hypothetical protein